MKRIRARPLGEERRNQGERRNLVVALPAAAAENHAVAVAAQKEGTQESENCTTLALLKTTYFASSLADSAGGFFTSGIDQ